MSAWKTDPAPAPPIRVPAAKYEALLSVVEHARACVEEGKVEDRLLVEAIAKWDAIREGGA